jgi:hypothetical protein
MNEEYELKKIVKIGAKVGGVWGFVNGLFLILSSLGGVANTTFHFNSIYTYIFLPYYIVSNIIFTTVVQEILSSILNVVGTNVAGGMLLNIIAVLFLVLIPTLIGAIVIGGIAMLIIISKDFI